MARPRQKRRGYIFLDRSADLHDPRLCHDEFANQRQFRLDRGVTLDWTTHVGVGFYDMQADTTPNFNSPALRQSTDGYIQFE